MVGIPGRGADRPAERDPALVEAGLAPPQNSEIGEHVRVARHMEQQHDMAPDLLFQPSLVLKEMIEREQRLHATGVDGQSGAQQGARVRVAALPGHGLHDADMGDAMARLEHEGAAQRPYCGVAAAQAALDEAQAQQRQIVVRRTRQMRAVEPRRLGPVSGPGMPGRRVGEIVARRRPARRSFRQLYRRSKPISLP